MVSDDATEEERDDGTGIYESAVTLLVEVSSSEGNESGDCSGDEFFVFEADALYQWMTAVL